MNFNILWEKHEKIALALSGGVDSIVLFHLLVTKYQDTYKELVIFHINHGLREESAEEENYVLEIAAAYGVKCYVKKLNMTQLTKRQHTSEEMLARELRYNAFSEMLEESKAALVLTAHHKNDCIENIIMRLLSGRSIDYSLSIEQKAIINGVEVRRPLLDITKEELQSYAAKNNLTFYEDKTNNDIDYTRNYIRHKIVPLLNEVNEGSFNNLVNFSNYYSNINKRLKDRVLNEKQNYIEKIGKNKITFSNDLLEIYNDEEIFFIIKDVLTNYFGVFDIKQRAIFTALKTFRQDNSNKDYNLKNNLKISREYGTIYIHKIEKKWYNDKIELIIDSIDTKEYKFGSKTLIISTKSSEGGIGFSKEDLPLIITHRKTGDKIKRGSIIKKLSRILIDEKVPKEIRDELLVIRSDEEILGVLGLTKQSKKIKYDYYINMKG